MFTLSSLRGERFCTCCESSKTIDVAISRSRSARPHGFVSAAALSICTVMSSVHAQDASTESKLANNEQLDWITIQRELDDWNQKFRGDMGADFSSPKTAYPISESLIDWHLRMFREAIRSDNARSWETLVLAGENIHMAGLRSPFTLTRAKIILLEKPIPEYADSPSVISALRSAIWALHGSNNKDDVSLTVSTIEPAFWQARLDDRRATQSETRLHAASEDEAFILKMRLESAKVLVDKDPSRAVKLLKPILQREDENDRYLALLRIEYNRAVTIDTTGVDPKLEWVKEQLESI